MAQAEEETDAPLTDGLDTPEHHLFVAEDVGSGQRVGHLWFGSRPRNPDPYVAWLYDTTSTELTVFGDNDRAKRLYESTGYVEMARQLGKDLP